MKDIPSLLARAIEENAAVLEQVKSEQWLDPTPCTEWDLRALTNHLTSELLWVPPLLDGKTIEEVGDQFDGVVVGEDPAASFAEAGKAAAEAAGTPGSLEVTTHLSFGDFPGHVYLEQILFDMVIHGWDVRKGARLDATLPQDLREWATGYAAREVENWRAGGALAPAIELGPDASPQDELIALTGRSPAWPL